MEPPRTDWRFFVAATVLAEVVVGGAILAFVLVSQWRDRAGDAAGDSPLGRLAGLDDRVVGWAIVAGWAVGALLALRLLARWRRRAAGGGRLVVYLVLPVLLPGILWAGLSAPSNTCSAEKQKVNRHSLFHHADRHVPYNCYVDPQRT